MTRVATVLLFVTLGSAAVAKPRPPPRPPTPKTSPSTGFDLSIDPPEETGVEWRLDGELRSEKLPAKLRNIRPGKHVIRIAPPPPYLDAKLTITVAYGITTKVEIKLVESP